MHFPGNIAKKIFSRLISLGAVVIVIGVSLIGFQDVAKAGMNLKQPVLAGLVCIGIGMLFVTIAVMALILQRTWGFKGVKICSKTAQKKVSLNQGNPELAGMDVDVDEEEAEDEGFQKSTRFQIGDTLDIQLKIKSLKPMEILKAICPLIVEHRSKKDLGRLKAVYKNAVEDINNSGRRVRKNQTVTYRFEQQLPEEPEVSSYTVMWKLRLEIKAKGTADFLQDIPLKITA
jgi:hypothetical protein